MAASLGVAHGQAGVGKEYGSRDPFVCKPQMEPAKGAPSPSQLKEYVRCQIETQVYGGFRGILMENVQVEVGKSRPYSAFTDSGAGDIDNSQPVYPIRGSADYYQCYVPGHTPTVAIVKGSCQVLKAEAFAGVCYKTTFGNWSCPTSYPPFGTKAEVAEKNGWVDPPK